MFKRFVAFFCMLSSVFSPENFASCGPGKLGLAYIHLDPAYPSPGKDLTVILNGKPTMNIDQASTSVSVNIFGLELGETHFDVCREMNMECPLVAGKSVSGSLKYGIPSIAPKELPLNVNIKTFSNNELIDCQKMRVTIK